MSRTPRAPRSLAGVLVVLGVLPVVGCEPAEDATLSRLVEAWSDVAVERAAPTTTASLLMARLAVEICTTEQVQAWQGVELGAEPPLSYPLQQALGSPIVKGLKLTGSSLAEVTLSGARVAGRDDVRVQISPTTADSGEMNISVVVLDPINVDDETGEPDPYGRTAWTVQAGCEATTALVAGTSRWVDLEQRAHTIDLPADSELTAGMRFNRKLTYVPSSGTLAWVGRIDGQEVALTTDDAEGLVLSEAGADTGVVATEPVAAWEAVVRGEDWLVTTSLPIDPSP